MQRVVANRRLGKRKNVGSMGGGLTDEVVFVVLASYKYIEHQSLPDTPLLVHTHVHMHASNLHIPRKKLAVHTCEATGARCQAQVES